MLDVAGGPPRQGDGDEGRALVLDDPDADPWGLLLAMGGALVGARPWWPDRPDSVAAAMVRPLIGSHRPLLHRPPTAPRDFPDAGICLLRTPPEDGPEIWCRCDGGPHGFLSIAAHAHADALSVEVRHDGVEVLVDPGTYCYHGEPQWRSYFRSTLAHNTVEVDGENQSVEGGPFLWSTRTEGHATRVEVGDLPLQTWSAFHTGYEQLDPTLRHERTVTLDRVSRSLSIFDVLTCRTPHAFRLAFHLAPEVEVLLVDGLAELSWTHEQKPVTAELRLPGALRWTTHRGETDPVLGWYSPRFGERVPTTTLLGEGAPTTSVELRSDLVFHK
jgi:hypothetical protein